MCCEHGIHKSIMDCNNGILIDNTTCPPNDKSLSFTGNEILQNDDLKELSLDFSSTYFMEEI